jgi:NADPH:quinone reductase-like Zn-dependent oxidoreductase
MLGLDISATDLKQGGFNMHAARIHSFGSPDVLTLDEVPMPEPKRDEILVKVRAASVNPIDNKMRSGQYPIDRDKLPVTLGRDVSGVVARCGEEVMTCRPGDEVYAMLDAGHGGYAEYVLVRERDLVKKPARLDYAEAAAVPLAAITAWQGLFDHGHLEAGQHVLIHGGAGGVGHFAIQFAKQRGAIVSTTVASEDVDFAHELGADRAIDYKHERFENRVGEVDLVLDLVAGDTQDRSWNVVKKGGAIVSTLSQPSKDKAAARGARGESYVAKPNAAELGQIGQLIDEGKVKPHVDAVFSLGDAAQAMQRLEDGHVRGKIVIEIEQA